MQLHLDIDGFCHGPLFAPLDKIRKPVRYRMSGGAYVWIKYRRARPAWADIGAIADMWLLSKAVTLATGVQHSVDHIVPLLHPLVCGLHVSDNLRIIPLIENQRKCNNHWPDMPTIQQELSL